MIADTMTSLRESLAASNSYFKYMLSLLPAQLVATAKDAEPDSSDVEEDEDVEPITCRFGL